jgi:hypothetical protein
MNQDFLLRLALRVRELMVDARNDIAREQLRMWAEEFEEQAALMGAEPAEFARREPAG